MKKRQLLLSVILAIYGIRLFAQTTPPSLPDPSVLYGVIEVGSSGIKSMVVEKLPGISDDGNPPIKTLKEFTPVDANPYDGAVLDNVTKAISEVHSQMASSYHVADDHLYIVGSSGIPPSVRTAISGKVLLEGVSIEFIDVATESRLIFKGIVPPNRYKLNEVVVLDIGSGNTKGAYLSQDKSPVQFATFSIKWGTKTFAKEVNKTKSGGAVFMVAAEPLANEILTPAVQEQVRNFPGMQNCSRLYLTGGLPWAMTTLVHPEQIIAATSWVPLKADDINAFFKKATTDPGHILLPDLGKVPAKDKKKVEDDIARIGKIFNQDQLMSGALILKTFMNEMNFTNKTAIFFSKRALYAWPQGYIQEKIGTQTGSSAQAVPK